MIKWIVPALILLLAGCSISSEITAQKAQNAKPDPAHIPGMEQLCRQKAAHRYNTGVQQIDVTGFEQFQSSYEMRGVTPRNEVFVCAFDTKGQFMHLSMR
ncbi:YsaB family lipoprotein [Salmonella enterica]